MIKLSVESEYLHRQVPCIVYLPKGYGDGQDYPVWYGLHSYSTGETMWIDNGIGEVADKLIESGDIKPLVMVFPYTRYPTLKEIEKDIEEKGDAGEDIMERFLYKELVPYIDSRYDTITSADGRYIGGFSMGGAIALRVAFHHPEIFSKVGGYSAAVTVSDYSGTQFEKWLFPSENTDEIADVARFAKKKGLDKLSVYLDAGNSNDPFSAGLQSLSDALQQRNIKCEMQIYDGGHTLRKEALEEYLKFYAAKGTD